MPVLRTAWTREAARHPVLLVLSVILIVVYVAYLALDVSQDTSSSNPRPFDVSVVNDSEIRVSRVEFATVNFEDISIEPNTDLRITWYQERPGPAAFAFALPSGRKFEYVGLKTRKLGETDWQEEDLVGVETSSTFRKDSVAGKSFSYLERSTDQAHGLLVAFNRLPEAEYSVRAVGEGSKAAHDEHLARTGWSRQVARFALSLNSEATREVFPDSRLMPLYTKGDESSVAIIKYVSTRGRFFLSDPIPDPETIHKQIVLWRKPLVKDDLEMSSQVTVVNDLQRYWVARFNELNVLILGALLGVFIDYALRRPRTAPRGSLPPDGE